MERSFPLSRGQNIPYALTVNLLSYDIIKQQYDVTDAAESNKNLF